MTLLQEQKDAMHSYYETMKNNLYASNSLEKRKSLGQFYTPDVLGARMLEKYDCNLKEFKDKTILDPTAGSGLLLAYALIAGATPDKVFGIELDPVVLELGQKRLCEDGVDVPVVDFTDVNNPKVLHNADGSIKTKNVKIPKHNFHLGNALNKDCFIFPESPYETEHKGTIYKFNPNVGDVGDVEFINSKTGIATFKFGGF